MKNIFILILILIIFSFPLSAGTLNISTTPEGVSVTLKKTDGSSVNLGKSPLKKSFSDVISGNGDAFFEFEKEGYFQKSVLIPFISKADVNMKISLQEIDASAINKKMDQLVSIFFEIQRLTKVQSYDEALVLITKIKSEYPGLSSVYEMEGSIFYMKKEIKNSYNSFYKAVILNPDNTEASKMKDFIQSQIKLEKSN